MAEEGQDPQQQTQGQGTDPFSLDESAFASLTPEQRAGLDPVLNSWKEKASAEISKKDTEWTEKVKAYEEKAKALDNLTNYQPFVQWWQTQNKNQAQPQTQNPQVDPALQTAWQEAIWAASNGDPTKLQQLQAQGFAQLAAPVFQKLQKDQEDLRMGLELKSLFDRHEDAKELDKIGLDPKTMQGTSLLQTALEWAESQGKPLEEGYKLARVWADHMKVGAQQQAMGMVQDKKQGVTASPSTNNANKNIVEVGDMDELITRSMEATLDGNKDVQFAIRG